MDAYGQQSPGPYEDHDDDDEEDDDELIIVTMLRSMNSKKLETCQLKEMKLEIDIEKIRNDIKLEYFKELQKRYDTKIENEWRSRLVRFDIIFNKIIAKKILLDEQNAQIKKFEDQIKAHEERLKNPFYMTLKAQKEERDKFIDFYTNGVLLGLPSINVSGKHDNDSLVASLPQNEEQDQQIETEPTPREINTSDALGDLFKHTGVDIEDAPRGKDT